MRAIASLIAACLLAGCGSDLEKPRAERRSEPALHPAPAQVNRGELLFERHCRRCHAVNGSGGDRGVDLSRAGLRYTPLMLRTMIAHGASPEMRAVLKLSDEEQTAVIVYLSSLR